MKDKIESTGRNPKRRVKRYCSGKTPVAGTKTIDSQGHDLKKIKKNELMTRSSALTELRKQAKSLGIPKVNTYAEEALKKKIAEISKPAMPPDPPKIPVKTETPPDEISEKDRKAELKDKIQALTNDRPKGNPSVSTLESILKEATEQGE